jgi:hypothetical protein
MSQKRERDCNEMKTKKNPGYQMHKLAKGTRKKKKKKPPASIQEEPTT